MADFGQLFASFTLMLLLVVTGDPLRIFVQLLPLQKLEGLSYPMLKTARSYLYSSGQDTRMCRTDGQTDGQTDRHRLAITAVCIAGNADVL